MKIVDEKGMIFGKINVVDFIVILFLLFLTPTIYFGQKMLGSKKPQKEEIAIQVGVKFLNVLVELADVMKEGDVKKDSAGRVVGTLTKIVSRESPAIFSLSVKDSQFVMSPDTYSQSRDIIAELNLKCREQDGALYFDTYVIKIGSPILFSTDLYDIQGTIISIKAKE